MSSNVHALELGRASKRVDVGRPDRADVEAAFRTIIRWTGDDPERPGLIETPARVARAFDEFFRRLWPGSRVDFGEEPSRKPRAMTR
jgi:GTP cyclohydrolase IA